MSDLKLIWKSAMKMSMKWMLCPVRFWKMINAVFTKSVQAFAKNIHTRAKRVLRQENICTSAIRKFARRFSTSLREWNTVLVGVRDDKILPIRRLWFSFQTPSEDLELRQKRDTLANVLSTLKTRTFTTQASAVRHYKLFKFQSN